MTPFEIAAVLLGLGGLAGVGWTLWPVLRPAADPDAPTDEDPLRDGDWLERVRSLADIPASDDDEGRPWTDRRPLLPAEPRRIPADVVPWEALPLLRDGDRAWLLPIGSALVRAPFASGPTLRGRRHGRAFHGVRLEADVFLDLVEMVRLLPVLGCELAARQVSATEVGLHADLDAFSAATGLGAGAVAGAIAPWIVGEEAPRVVPEADGASTHRWTFPTGTLEVVSWTPAVARGIRRDRLGWAGVATWTGADGTVIDSGATSAEVLGSLGVDPAVRAVSLEAWRWSRAELVEVAGLGHHLEREGIDITALVDDAFADRSVPVPADPEDALVVAAVLNWRGVVARRAGRTADALAAFDAALSVCAPDDDDNRADILYNRGYSRLQGAMAVPPEGMGGELHAGTFVAIPDRTVLDPALADFVEASRLNPGDAHAWSQQALVHQLLGDARRAEDCWLQAATRTKDPDAHVQLLANARAARTPVVPGPPQG